MLMWEPEEVSMVLKFLLECGLWVLLSVLETVS